MAARSFVNPLTQGRAVELLNAGKVDMETLIADRIPLEGLKDALAAPNKHGKVIVIPS